MESTKIPKSKAKTAYGLLTEVKRLILKEPKRYDQTLWIVGRTGGDHLVDRSFPACDTVGCVFGWVAMLKGPLKFEFDETYSIARKILGLTEGQTYKLVHPSAAKHPPQTKAHAQSGARHITRFQKTYMAQLKAKKV